MWVNTLFFISQSKFLKLQVLFFVCKFQIFDRLMPGGNKKVTYTYLNKPAAFSMYVWPFCDHQALKG